MTCVQDYRQLLADLDVEIARIGEMHAEALSCGPGCAFCCQAFSVLSVEAACLRKAIADLPAVSQGRLGDNLAEDADCCPLLIDELCSVYAVRPVICRTQGLPLAYVNADREALEVSACPLNFPDEYVFAQEHLLFLDVFNSRLSEINRAWCLLQCLDASRRIPLREIARSALSGV